MRLFRFGSKEVDGKEEKTIDGIARTGVERVLSLRKKMWKIEIDPTHFFAFLRTHQKLIGSAMGIFLIVLSGLIFSHSKADVATFYPRSCLGAWDTPQNAEGELSLTQESLGEDFTSDNSAVLKNSNAELYCGDFEGTIPENTFPQKAVLHLVWSVDTGDVNHDGKKSEIETPSGNTTIPSDSTDSTSTDIPADTSSATETEGTISGDSTTVPVVDETPAPAEPEPTPAPTEEPVSFGSFIPIARAADEVPEESIAETPTPTTDSTPSSEEVVPSSAVPEDADVPPSTDTPVEELTEAAPVVEMGNDFMEISFTKDGKNWKTLAKISWANWKTGFYDLPVDLSEWKDIQNYQIKLTPLSTIDTQPVVYVDGMSIEVTFEENKIIDKNDITVKMIDPSLDIVSGEKDPQNDGSFEFTVIDPDYSTNELRNLVEEGKVEVVEDKKGVLAPQKEDSGTNSFENPVLPFLNEKKNEEVLGDPPKDESGSTTGFLGTPSKHMTSVSHLSAAIKAAASRLFPSYTKEHLFVAQEKNGLETKTHISIGTIFMPHIAYAQTVVAPVEVTILDSQNQEADIDPIITTTYEGGRPHYHVSLQRPREFRPGRYHMQVTLHTNGTNIISEQDFSWGVLSINIDRSVETPGKQAHLEFGVLDDTGNTICNSDLRLKITGPTGTEYNFNTDDDTIIRSPECGPNNVIEVPDYYAEFMVPNIVGTYQMVLTGLTTNGERTISDNFIVQQNPTLDVRRVTATRIQPLSNYPVTMYITSAVEWTGTIIEKVPASFGILPPQNSLAYSSVETVGDAKVISWNDVTLSAGEVKTIGYYYDAPDISPEFYLLGPLVFKNQNNTELFREARSWQIASDGSCQTTAGPTGNWSTAGTWTGTCTGTGGKPGAGDTVTINAGFTVTMDEASAVLGPLTVNGTLDTSGTNYGLSFTTLSIGSAGTVTANGSAIAVSGTSGTLLTLTSGGVFTGGTSVVTVTGNGSSTLNGGTGTFTGSNKLTTLTLNRTGVTYTLGADLEVSGTTTITLGTLDTNNSSNYALSTGKISIANSASAILNARASTITITGITSTLFSRGASGVFTQGTSEVKVVPASASATGITFLSGTETFHKLTIDASNLNVLNAGAAITMSSASAANKLYIKSGVLNDGGNQITGTANGTLVIDGGAALCIGGRATGTLTTCDGGATPTTATTFPSNYTNGNITLAATSTVYYNFNANAGVSIVPTYGNLKFRAVLATSEKTYTIDSGTLTVTGDWDIFPQAGSALKLTVSMSGAAVVTGTTRVSHGNSSGASGSLLSTNNNALTTGFIILGTGGCGSIAKCTLDAGSSTITLTGTSGTLYTRSTNAVFTQGTSEVIVTSASGTPTLLSTGITVHRLTINSTATVINAGAVITMSSTDAANRLYIQAGVLNDGGSTIVGTANGTLVIDGGAMLCIGGTAAGTNATCNSGATVTSSVSFPTNYTNGNITLAATSTVAYLGDVATTVSSTPTYGNLTLNPTITSARTYTAGGALTINGNLTLNPTAASALALTANPAGAITVAAGKTTTIQGSSSATSTLDLRPSATDYNLSTGLINIASGGTLDATSAASTITITGTSGTLWTQTGTFTITSGTPTVTLSGNGDATVNSGTPTFYDLTSSGTGTKTLGGNITVNHVMTISAGTFGGGSSTMTLAGTTGTPFVNSSSFSADTGTVSYTGNNGSGNTTVVATTYYNLTFNASETFVLAGTTTVNAAGTTTITTGTLDTTASNFALSTGKLSVAGTLTANASVITLTAISGTLFTRTGTFTQGTSEVVVTGASGTPTLLSAATTFHKLTINTSATVVNAGAVITMSNTSAANKLYIQAGVLNDDGNTIVGTSNGTLVVDGGAALCISGTASGTSATCNSGATPTSASTFPTNYTNGNITLAVTSTVYYLANGTQTISEVPTYGNLILSPIITAGRTYTFGGAMTINGNFTINPTAASALALTVNSAGDITVATGKTTTVTGTTSGTSTLDLRPSATDYNLSTGNMTIGAAGTVDCTSAASVITVAVSWSNAGTFTAGSSEVKFNTAATASIGGGPTTFYKLTITHTAAKEVDFSTNALHIIHVTNLFSVTGSAAQLIKLYSSSGGTKWHFHPTGTASVDYADVKDGGCESGAITISPTHSTDSLNNDSCWSFFSPTATFAISDNTVGFGALSASAAHYATGDLAGDTSQVEAHTIAATTNAPYGYTILVNGNTLTSGVNTVAAIGGTNTASSAGTAQYGIRMTASGGSGAVSVPYAAAGFALDTGSFPDEIASASSGDGVTTTYSVRYLANISSTTPPGAYTSTLTYIMVPNF